MCLYDLTYAVRLWWERIASESNDLRFGHTMLGEGEHTGVIVGEVELQLRVDVERVCNVIGIKMTVRHVVMVMVSTAVSCQILPELFLHPPAVTPLCQAPL